jgi:hypothetical protein
MHVEVERARNLVAQISARSFSGDASNHLANQMSESNRMVAMPGARLPPWFMRRERCTHHRPVEVRVHRQLLSHRGQSRAMTQQIIYRNFVLARLRELRPVLRHRRVEIQHPLIDQPMRTNGRKPLGRRVHVDERIARPRLGLRLVGMTTPKIDDGLSIKSSSNSRPNLDPVIKAIRKNFPDARESRIATTLNPHGHGLFPRMSTEIFDRGMRRVFLLR